MVCLESGAGPSEGGEDDEELAELAEEMPETSGPSIELAAFPESVLLFSLYVPEVLLEAAAVHERAHIFSLLFLLGRAVRAKQDNFDQLTLCARHIFDWGRASARGSNLFAVVTGA